jgi:hypothetical protein
LLGYGLLIVRFSSDLLSTIEQVDGIVREAACIANVRHTFILDLESVWSIAQSCMIAVTQVAHEGYALGRRPENDVDCRPNQEDQKAVDDRLPSSLADAHPRILVINALSAASRSARVNHLRAVIWLGMSHLGRRSLPHVSQLLPQIARPQSLKMLSFQEAFPPAHPHSILMIET